MNTNNDSDELFNNMLDGSPLLKHMSKLNKPDDKELTPEQRAHNLLEQITRTTETEKK